MSFSNTREEWAAAHVTILQTPHILVVHGRDRYYYGNGWLTFLFLAFRAPLKKETDINVESLPLGVEEQRNHVKGTEATFRVA